MEARKRTPVIAHLQKDILAGLVVLTPVLVTWLVFEFLLGQLIGFGRPWLSALYQAIQPFYPKLANWLFSPWLQSTLAAMVTLLILYLLGLVTSRMIGRQILIGFELLLERIPVLKAIDGSTKRLLTTFQARPEQIHRVVLINFPSGEMKTVGFVTHMVRDEDTGEELAVVYMPTAPNPTSGYMEIVPMSKVTLIDWTVEEGMQFVISCGTSVRERLCYRSDADPEHRG